MFNKRLLFLCLLLLAAVPARAQWSGSIDLAGGFGTTPPNEEDEADRLNHWLTKGAFAFQYQRPTWIWSTTLDGQWEPNESDTQRSVIKDALSIVLKETNTKPYSAGLRSQLSLTPAGNRKYDIWIKYRFKHDEGYHETVKMDYSLKEDGDDSFNYYGEHPIMNEHALSAGMETSHQLGTPRKVLQTSFTVESSFNRQLNTWGVYKYTGRMETAEDAGDNDQEEIGEEANWIYRITPRNNVLNTAMQVHLRDSVLCGRAKLVLDPGVRLNTLHNLDYNSGATLDQMASLMSDQDVWIDSLRLRESFDFLTLKAVPYLAADFSWESLSIHADYGLQFHGRRLNDDDHWQAMSLHGVYPVGKGSLNWKIGQHHRLRLGNSLDVQHPDYFQICWYERTGGYLNQLYRGNEKLPSTRIRKYDLSYDFQTRHFLSNTAITLTRKVNETDQTWSDEEIEGRLYKVFTWINAADSWTLGATQKLGYSGKVLSAHLGVGYNHTLRISRETGQRKESTDWKLTADAKAELGWGWSIQADARYQSKVATFFSIFGEYCVLNARLQKKFTNMTVYLEGRDLLDNPRTTSFDSADHREMWYEVSRLNRRLIVLGLNWSLK